MADSAWGDEKRPRLTESEMKIILQKHHLLDYLKDPPEGIEEVKDQTNLIMFLSRRARSDETKARSRKKKGDQPQRRDSNQYLIQAMQSSDGGNEATQSRFPDAQRYREKRRHLATSLATLVMQPDKRKKVVEDGAVAVLVQLSGASDPVVRKCCASSFAFLSTVPNLRDSMIDSGVIGALVQICATKVREYQSNCIKAMLNLTMGPGTEVRCAKEGGTLLAAHAGQYRDLLALVLKLLVNMSSTPDRYPRIEEVSDALMHISDHHDDLSEYEDELLIAALTNLAALRQNQLRLLESGVMKVVEKNIHSKNENILILVSRLISNLTTDPRSRIKLVDVGIIRILLQMVKVQIDDVRSNAVVAFHSLSRDVACREKVVSAGAVKVVVDISLEDNLSIHLARTVAGTIRVLCDDESIVGFLLRDGVVKALYRLKNTNDKIVLHRCIEALCALYSQSSEVVNKLINMGTVGLLGYICENMKDENTAEWCAFALLRLSYRFVCPIEFLSTGVLPAIIKLLGNTNSIQATNQCKLFCAHALAELTAERELKSSIAISILVKMLQDESIADIKTRSATALYNLAVTRENCFMMLKAGALLPIIQLTRSDHLETKVRCAAILSRLTAYQEYHSVLNKADIRRLVDLSAIDSIITQRRVVVTLSNLSVNEDIRNMLLDIPEAGEAMKLLISRPDDSMRSGCAAILCNLSAAYGSEHGLIKMEIVPTLLVTALLASDKPSCKLVCVKSILNLMSDPSVHKYLVKDGVIWGLSSLAALYMDEVDDIQTPNADGRVSPAPPRSPGGEAVSDVDVMLEIVELCARALCNLSREFSKEVLHSAVTVKVVMAFIVSSKVALLRYGSRILLQMLQATEKKDEKFRVIAVERMAVVSCNDEEVSKLTILCLCLCSQSELCREVIVRCGILHSIDAYTIFRESRLSFAYLTMVGNIAQAPSMRARLLDSSSLSKFDEMTNNKEDPAIHLALSKVLYNLSCSEENIAFFANVTDKDSKFPMEGSIQLSRLCRITASLLENPHVTVKDEIFKHMAAFLYNLTIRTEFTNAFLAQGVVLILKELWSKIKNDEVGCKLVCMSCCNLACGNVNTSKLLEDGLVQEVLSFIADSSKKKIRFSEDELACWSAAVRNIMHVVHNQTVLIESGVISGLVVVANECWARIKSAGKSTNTEALIRTWRNCTAALRAITYNEKERDKLEDMGALDVIILDSKKDLDDQDLGIGINLLHEIEAESWKNGTRGILKDGRSRDIFSAKMREDFLGAGEHVAFNYSTELATINKMMVTISVPSEEGLEEAERVPMMDLKDVIGELGSIDIGDAGASDPITVRVPKCEIQISELSTSIRELLEDGDYLPLSDSESDSDELGAEINVSATPEAAIQLQLPQHGLDTSSADKVIVASSGGAGTGGISAFTTAVVHEMGDNTQVAKLKSNLKVAVELENKKAELLDLPQLSPMKESVSFKSPDPARRRQKDHSHSMPSITSPGFKSPKKGLSKDQKFEKLVSLISVARKAKSISTNDISSQWKEMSQF